MKYLPSSHCRLLMNPCIIKNDSNPTIMSYCDNQKPLMQFLPVLPLTHQLPECIFPVSFESVSPKKGGVWGGPQKAHTSPGAPMSITRTRCSSLSTDSSDIAASVFAHSNNYITRWKMVSGAMEQRCGSYSITHALACVFLFAAILTWFHPSHRFPAMIYKCSGGQTLGTPVVYPCPFFAEDFQMRPTIQSWKHLTS